MILRAKSELRCGLLRVSGSRGGRRFCVQFPVSKCLLGRFVLCVRASGCVWMVVKRRRIINAIRRVESDSSTRDRLYNDTFYCSPLPCFHTTPHMTKDATPFLPPVHDYTAAPVVLAAVVAPGPGLISRDSVLPLTLTTTVLGCGTLPSMILRASGFSR